MSGWDYLVVVAISAGITFAMLTIVAVVLYRSIHQLAAGVGVRLMAAGMGTQKKKPAPAQADQVFSVEKPTVYR